MQKIVLFLSLIFTSITSFAANKIEMVTYFPVPYVAYSKVTPKNQLDIGLTSSCQMSLGCAESGYSLRATTANLNRNRLDLNGAAAVVSTNVTVGSGYGAANVDFTKNLRIGTLDKGYSVETPAMTVDSLTLFASHMKSGGALFPDCKTKSGEETISWQSLKLKDKSEVYLMCGKPAEVDEPEPDCSDMSYLLAHKQECCCSISPEEGDSACWKYIARWYGSTIGQRDAQDVIAPGHMYPAGNYGWMDDGCSSWGSCSESTTTMVDTGYANCWNYHVYNPSSSYVYKVRVEPISQAVSWDYLNEQECATEGDRFIGVQGHVSCSSGSGSLEWWSGNFVDYNCQKTQPTPVGWSEEACVW